MRLKNFFVCLVMSFSFTVEACYYDFSSMVDTCATIGANAIISECSIYGNPHYVATCDLDHLMGGNNHYYECYGFIGQPIYMYKVCPELETSPALTKLTPDLSDKVCGSIISTDTQVISEVIDIVGVPFPIVYSSDKMKGRTEWYTARVPLTTSYSYTPGIDSIDVSMIIESQNHSISYTPASNLDHFFVWDGKDALGNPVKGSRLAFISVEEKFSSTCSSNEMALIGFGEQKFISSGYSPGTVCVQTASKVDSNVLLGSIFDDSKTLGGWDFSVRHQYDPVRKTLFKGDGNSFSTSSKIQASGDHWVVSQDRSEIYVFNSNLRHTKTLNAINNTSKLTFNYNGNGQLTSVVDIYGNTTSVQYTSNLISSITSPYGQVTSISTDGNGYIDSITNPASEIYEMTYDSKGLLLTFEKPNGVISSMTYDPQGRLLTDSSSAGSSTTLARTEVLDGYSVSETSEVGRVRNHGVTLSNDHYTRSTVSGNSYSEYYSLSMNDGNITTNNSSSYYSNSYTQEDPRFGFPLTIPNYQTVNRGYNSKTTYYSETPNLVDPSDPFSFTYLVSTWTTNSKTTTSTYDPTTRTSTLTTPLNRTLTTILNTKGDVVSAQMASLTPITYSYDLNGRIEDVAQGVNRTVHLTYHSGNGFLASIENAYSEIVSFTYDLAGRILTQTLPDSRVITYTYDSNGNVSSITPPGKPAHTLNHNGFDLISSYVPPTVSAPSSVTSTYYYNDDRELIQITRPDSQSIDFNYNSTTGNLDSITLPTGFRTFNYSNGILANSTSEDGVSSYLQFGGDKLVYESVTSSLGLNYEYSNVFNSDHLRISESLTVGSDYSPISFSYDNDDLLTAAGSETLSRDTNTGFLTQIEIGSMEQNFDYSASFGELSEIEAKYSSTQKYKENMTRDHLGRIVTRVEQYGSNPSSTYGYTYDSVGRLTNVTLNSSALSSYSFDSNSNRTSQTISATTTNATYDDQDRLLTFGTLSFNYNINGEVASMTDSATSQTTTYDYDVLGNLKEVVLPSSTIAYTVDAHNRRISRSVGGVVQNFYVWNGNNQVIGVTDGSGVLTARFVYGSKSHVPDYATIGGVDYQIVSNHLGSPVVVVNTSTGAVVQEIKYNEFGKILSDSNPGFTPFGFAGCLYDVDTKLCRFGARDYDARVGRWLSKDPILFAGGDTNLYGYVMQDPINGIDPDGLKTTLITTYDWGFGSHSAILITNPGQASFLYDPAGSYKGPANLNSYINYHQSTGSRVSTTSLNTTSGQESQIINRILNSPSAGPLGCAGAVSSALGGACGIPGSPFPGRLEDQARNSTCK